MVKRRQEWRSESSRNDQMPRPISPVGKRVEFRKKNRPEDELLWSKKLPDGDNEYGTITLNFGTFRGSQLIIDDFGLGSPHAFRRRF